MRLSKGMLPQSPGITARHCPSATMEMEECPHQGLVRLFGFGGCHPQVLFHSRTGEIFRFPAGRRELHFCEEGFGFLTVLPASPHEEAETVWVNELLRLSLFKTADGAECVMSSDGGAPIDLRSVAHGGSVQLADFEAFGEHFRSEMYVFSHPQPVGADPGGCRRWFTLPWALHFMLGGGAPPHNRWACRHGGASLPSWLSDIGFSSPGGLVRPSIVTSLALQRGHFCIRPKTGKRVKKQSKR